jgi:hypothetical protein
MALFDEVCLQLGMAGLTAVKGVSPKRTISPLTISPLLTPA